MYAKNKDCYTNNNPFVDDFIDPLCKLNLRETSEFVKSFPLPKPNAENARFSNDSSTHLRKLEPPSTPGRPLFSFTSFPSFSIVGRNNLPRKSFPSKWDDAEKWLISTSCHDSARSGLTEVASTDGISTVFDGISAFFLGSAGRNALVAADPFHPSSTLLRNGFSSRTTGPLATEATVIEAWKAPERDGIGKGNRQGAWTAYELIGSSSLTISPWPTSSTWYP